MQAVIWFVINQFLFIMSILELLEEMKQFNPHPGAHLAPDSPHFITPEVTISEEDGEFVIIPNKEQIPRLRLSQNYLNILEDPSTSAEVKEYIREKLNKSKALRTI